MKHIKKFNENINNDAMYAISDSFNKVKQELDLLNKRLGKIEELDEFGSEISQMKINFDELLNKFNDFDNEFFGR
jgi:archaellum component FlaC